MPKLFNHRHKLIIISLLVIVLGVFILKAIPEALCLGIFLIVVGMIFALYIATELYGYERNDKK